MGKRADSPEVAVVRARWSELESADPEFARDAQDMVTKYGFCYLATASVAAQPRITPVSAVIADGGLYLSLIPGTAKCRELLSNPAFQLHALPGPNRAEFSVRGVARRVAGDERKRVVAAHRTADVVIEDDDVVFELLVGSAHRVEHHRVAGRLRAERVCWRPGRPTARGGDSHDRAGDGELA